MKKKVEIELCHGGDAAKCSKAMKIVVGFHGVTKASFNDDKSKLGIEGEGFDPVKIIKKLRKKTGHANITAMGEVKEEKEKEKEKEDKHIPIVITNPLNWPYGPQHFYCYEPSDPYQSSCTIM